jgi:peptidoglycan/xylan/chitin deacetylase (PgdA/CDA1 family)
MYHHLNSDRCSNEYAIFEQHLEYISQHFTSVFPSQDLPKNPICLVFDDGYFDFYKLIFPLLKKYNLKALLAVVPKYILDDIELEDEKRLFYEHNDLFKNYENGTFCTYKELKEMMESGLIQIVSHSYSHKNLVEDDVDVTMELLKSKEILEEKLHIIVESFVFPFGKYNQKVLDETKKYYKYPFRIGNGINSDFNGVHGVIYRIDGDNLENGSDIFSFKNILKFRIKTLIKSIVGNK